MGFLCSYLMELVALALPSKRTERCGILMTYGAHRKRRPGGVGPAAGMPLPINPPRWAGRGWDTPCAACRNALPVRGMFRLPHSESIAYAPIPLSQPCSAAAAGCSKSLQNDGQVGRIPPVFFDQRRHLPHPNPEASLGSGCRNHARRFRGNRRGQRRSTPDRRRRTSRSLAQQGAVNRCPSVIRKPTRLSLEKSAGGHPQRARQAIRRPCGTP